jgi:MoxR-like ATPase
VDHADLDGKRFELARPYRPDEYPRLVGLDEPLKMIQAAFLGGERGGLGWLPVHLTGPPGVGKSALAREAARQLGRELYIVQCHDGLTPDDLCVSVRPSDAAGLGSLRYGLSPLASAMYRGPSLVVLEELDKLRPRTAAVLCPVLDDRRSLQSALGGFELRGDDFRVIATSNESSGPSIPQFLQERLSVRVRLAPPSREDLDRIVRERLAESADRFLGLFWGLYLARPRERLPSPRVLLACAQLAFRFAALSGGLGKKEVERALAAVEA